MVGNGKLLIPMDIPKMEFKMALFLQIHQIVYPFLDDEISS